MEIKDYQIVDGFLECLKAHSCIPAFICSEQKLVMTLIAEFDHCMDWPCISFVLGLVDGKQF